MRNGEYTTLGTNLRQDYFFVVEDVHAAVKAYFAWAVACCKAMVAKYGKAWHSQATDTGDEWTIATQASYAIANKGDITETVYELATLAGAVKTDAEIEATYRQMDIDNARPVFGASGATMDEKRSKNQNSRTVNMDFRSELTADVRNTEGNFDDEDTSDAQSFTLCEGDVLSLTNAELKYTVAQITYAIETADKQPQRGKPTKYMETFQALRNVEWNAEEKQPNMHHLTAILGVSRDAAKSRYKSLLRLLTSGRIDRILAETL